MKIKVDKKKLKQRYNKNQGCQEKKIKNDRYLKIKVTKRN